VQALRIRAVSASTPAELKAHRPRMRQFDLREHPPRLRALDVCVALALELPALVDDD
jgi:hypothetical protein